MTQISTESNTIERHNDVFTNTEFVVTTDTTSSPTTQQDMDHSLLSFTKDNANVASDECTMTTFTKTLSDEEEGEETLSMGTESFTSLPEGFSGMNLSNGGGIAVAGETNTSIVGRNRLTSKSIKKNIVFFEVEGGSDKGPDGHRKDTMPMVDALKEHGWNGTILYYSDDKIDEIYDYVVASADAYVSRINPGNIPGGETSYFNLLRLLSAHGIIGMPHPDVMLNYGAKDALCKIIDTGLVPPDTLAYYSVDSLMEQFPKTLSITQRVLKQNRGSTGEGIWRVENIDERTFVPGTALPGDTKIKCTEAVDNHVEYRQLDEFMEFCTQYVVGAENSMIVDMRFMPRIKEGEIRILMVGNRPMCVVHKKPAEEADAFSATLFSGATYTYDEPEQWTTLITMFLDKLPMIMDKLGGYDEPLLWTADFILDYNDDGITDKYVLGEINCSCVGFTSDLDRGIQEAIAQRIITVVTDKKSGGSTSTSATTSTDNSSN